MVFSLYLYLIYIKINHKAFLLFILKFMVNLISTACALLRHNLPTVIWLRTLCQMDLIFVPLTPHHSGLLWDCFFGATKTCLWTLPHLSAGGYRALIAGHATLNLCCTTASTKPKLLLKWAPGLQSLHPGQLMGLQVAGARRLSTGHQHSPHLHVLSQRLPCVLQLSPPPQESGSAQMHTTSTKGSCLPHCMENRANSPPGLRKKS